MGKWKEIGRLLINRSGRQAVLPPPRLFYKAKKVQDTQGRMGPLMFLDLREASANRQRANALV